MLKRDKHHLCEREMVRQCAAHTHLYDTQGGLASSKMAPWYDAVPIFDGLGDGMEVKATSSRGNGVSFSVQ